MARRRASRARLKLTKTGETPALRTVLFRACRPGASYRPLITRIYTGSNGSCTYTKYTHWFTRCVEREVANYKWLLILRKPIRLFCFVYLFAIEIAYRWTRDNEKIVNVVHIYIIMAMRVIWVFVIFHAYYVDTLLIYLFCVRHLVFRQFLFCLICLCLRCLCPVCRLRVLWKHLDLPVPDSANRGA